MFDMDGDGVSLTKVRSPWAGRPRADESFEFDDGGYDANERDLGEDDLFGEIVEVDGVPMHVPPSIPLDALPAGGLLALDVDNATTRPASMGDAELVEAITALERVTAWAGARQTRLLAEFARRRPAAPSAVPVTRSDAASEMSRYAADEIAVALTVARGTALGRLADAVHLQRDLPATLDAWEAGLIDRIKARAIGDATLVLTPAVAREVEARVLDRATRQTPASLRASLRRAVIAADPDGAADRHKAANRQRRVVLTPEDEGMASLWALLPAPDALAAYETLSRLARGLGPHDPRLIDARRADLLADLLTGRLTLTDATRAGAGVAGASATADSAGSGTGEAGTRVAAPPSGKPLVHVLVGIDTLTGADDHPGELAGYGPIAADLAREIAAEAVWKRLLTDPASGALLDHGRTTYHPPAALADHVRARDGYCRFPGCRRRALDAELDHTRAWEDGGPTDEANLHALCVHHHRLKHQAGWQVVAHLDGSLTWTTPTGHRHTTEPYDYRPDPWPASPGGVVSAEGESVTAEAPPPY